jgi:transposase-like protein
VRLLHELRASGTTFTQVGRELDVRPDQLRVWARRLAERDGRLTGASGSTDEEEPDEYYPRLIGCVAR